MNWKNWILSKLSFGHKPKNPCLNVNIEAGMWNPHISTIWNGDTVSMNGIVGIYFTVPKFGIVAIRPVPAIKMKLKDSFKYNATMIAYLNGKLQHYHLEIFEQCLIKTGQRMVLVEKSMQHLTRCDRSRSKVLT